MWETNFHTCSRQKAKLQLCCNGCITANWKTSHSGPNGSRRQQSVNLICSLIQSCMKFWFVSFPSNLRSVKTKFLILSEVEGQRDNECIPYCVMQDFHSGVAVDSTLLGCDTVVRSAIPTFWRVKHVFIFNVNQLHPISEVTRTSNHWQLLTQRHSITSQMTGMLNFREIRHFDITLVLCYKFGLCITVSWPVINKSHWQHSSRVNITFMHHPVQEQLSLSVILHPSCLPLLFTVTWHTTAHTHPPNSNVHLEFFTLYLRHITVGTVCFI
jgi:hypothetical protein